MTPEEEQMIRAIMDRDDPWAQRWEKAKAAAAARAENQRRLGFEADQHMDQFFDLLLKGIPIRTTPPQGMLSPRSLRGVINGEPVNNPNPATIYNNRGAPRS